MSGFIRLYVIVEGETEKRFARELLKPHLLAFNVDVHPSAIVTSREGGQVIGRGGGVTFEKACREIQKRVFENAGAFITTMFDLYALHKSFTAKLSLPSSVSGLNKVKAIEDKLEKEIGHPRFVPYIQLHEFEALLFSDPAAIDDVFATLEGTPSRLDELTKIRKRFNSPEDINEGKTTAPSKRLISLFPSYKDGKPLYASLISESIGLETMRRECPHFAEWLARLESLPRNSAD